MSKSPSHLSPAADPASGDEDIKPIIAPETQPSGDAPNGTDPTSTGTATLGNASDPPASGDTDVTMDPSQNAVVQSPEETEKDATTEAAEARIAQKKEMTLREFLGRMDDYAPIIPDALTSHYLTLAGLPPPPTTPLPLARLLALATQKFIADIAADSYQYARIRQGHNSSNAAAGGAANLAGGGGGVAGAGAGASAGSAGQKSNALGTARAGYGGGGAGAGGQGAAGAGANAAAGGAGGAGGQGRTVLTMEDLGMAVGEYGVNVRRGEFYR